MTDKARLIYLFSQRFSGLISPEEKQELLVIVDDENNESLVEACIQEFMINPPAVALPAAADVNTILHHILQPATTQPGVAPPERQGVLLRLLTGRAVAAAMLILFLFTGTYLLWNSRKQPVPDQATAQQPVILPGKNGAILTLEDGSQVVLDSLGNGQIAQQNGATLVLRNNELQYSQAAIHAQPISNNLLSTPKGRQFNVTLPDGTKVWLNAASSISFPTVFTGPERHVTVSGEAYLEVAPDQAHPFFVRTPDAKIAVLGTAFNVHAYNNEALEKTTLVEGKVKITGRQSNTTPIVLNPGEQAQVSRNSGQLTKEHSDVNLNQVLAWRKGLFNFENVDFREAMRQLERWYDIEVVYENGVPGIQLGGKISRNVQLSDLLKGLEDADVHFKLQNGRKLIVYP